MYCTVCMCWSSNLVSFHLAQILPSYEASLSTRTCPPPADPPATTPRQHLDRRTPPPWPRPPRPPSSQAPKHDDAPRCHSRPTVSFFLRPHRMLHAAATARTCSQQLAKTLQSRSHAPRHYLKPSHLPPANLLSPRIRRPYRKKTYLPPTR